MKIKSLIAAIITLAALFTSSSFADQPENPALIEAQKRIEQKLRILDLVATYSRIHHVGVPVPRSMVPPRKIMEVPFGNTQLPVSVVIKHLAFEDLTVDYGDPTVTPSDKILYAVVLTFDKIKIETDVVVAGPRGRRLLKVGVNLVLKNLRLPVDFSATNTTEDMQPHPLELDERETRIEIDDIPKPFNRIFDQAGFFEAYKTQVHSELMKEFPTAILDSSNNRD